MDNLLSVLLIYIIGVVILMYVLTILPSKRKNKKVRAMHDSIAIGDEVATIGGIVGKVVYRDAEFVKILIDEKTGTEMKVVVMAVQTILEKAENQS